MMARKKIPFKYFRLKISDSIIDESQLRATTKKAS